MRNYERRKIEMEIVPRRFTIIIPVIECPASYTLELRAGTVYYLVRCAAASNRMIESFFGRAIGERAQSGGGGGVFLSSAGEKGKTSRPTERETREPGAGGAILPSKTFRVHCAREKDRRREKDRGAAMVIFRPQRMPSCRINLSCMCVYIVPK